MQINAIRNFSYGQSLKAHKAVEAPQPEQKPVESQGTTASIYFGKKDKNGKGMRNAAMAGLGSLVLLTAVPTVLSCDKDDSWAKSESISQSYSNANATAHDTAYFISTHGKGCACDSCCHGRDTIYKYITLPKDTEYIKVPVHDTTYIDVPGETVHDTTYIDVPGETVHDTTYIEVPKEIPTVVYVDTGSYHVTHDTITKWIDNWQKPIPLDTLGKWSHNFDIDDKDPKRINIVNYQGVREWEYGERFVANMNMLESSKNVLVYDREDLDWLGKHKGWGKDVYRIPTSRFTIQTYGGKKLNSPKGIFLETYSNPWDEKTSIHDNNLVQRYFFQTAGDSVNVFSYDAKTGLYKEDGRFSKGYLDKASVGGNILLTDLIASDPKIRWGRDPEYSTEDHIVGAKVVKVSDEELKLMYVRARDEEYAEQHYGVANK